MTVSSNAIKPPEIFGAEPHNLRRMQSMVRSYALEFREMFRIEAWAHVPEARSYSVTYRGVRVTGFAEEYLDGGYEKVAMGVDWGRDSGLLGRDYRDHRLACLQVWYQGLGFGVWGLGFRVSRI